jgi:hypothetical protein
VVEQNDRFSGAISAQNSTKIGAPRRRLYDCRFNTLAIENAFEECGRLDFISGWVGRVDLDISAQQ